jgi:hypothetical protein
MLAVVENLEVRRPVASVPATGRSSRSMRRWIDRLGRPAIVAASAIGFLASLAPVRRTSVPPRREWRSTRKCAA